MLPNPFTALRLLLVPALWALALAGLDRWLGVGLAAAALTDVLDGRLARRDPRYADGRFDSVADKVLTASVVVWLVLRRPALFREHPWLIGAAVVLQAAVLLVAVLKFRRVSGLHLHSGKLGGLAQAVFVVHALVAGGYSPPLFYLAIGLFLIALAEELAVLLTHAQIDEEAVRSVWPFVRAWLAGRQARNA